jgi:Ca2+/Na+ antiporter
MKKIRKKIEDLGLSYKREMMIFIIGLVLILLISAALVIFLKKAIYLLLGVFLLLIFVFLFIFRYKSKEEENNRRNINDFINYFSFFRIYISNGESVYSAFNNTIDFASDSLKPLIEGLLAEINNDKSITPFLRLAANFNTKLVEEIMISVFEMVDNGNNLNYINQFTSLFENFKRRINEENSEKRISRFDSYITTSLAGSGLIMVILVFGIVNLIGEII